MLRASVTGITSLQEQRAIQTRRKRGRATESKTNSKFERNFNSRKYQVLYGPSLRDESEEQEGLSRGLYLGRSATDRTFLDRIETQAAASPSSIPSQVVPSATFQIREPLLDEPQDSACPSRFCFQFTSSSIHLPVVVAPFHHLPPTPRGVQPFPALPVVLHHHQGDSLSLLKTTHNTAKLNHLLSARPLFPRRRCTRLRCSPHFLRSSTPCPVRLRASRRVPTAMSPSTGVSSFFQSTRRTIRQYSRTERANHGINCRNTGQNSGNVPGAQQRLVYYCRSTYHLPFNLIRNWAKSPSCHSSDT